MRLAPCAIVVLGSFLSMVARAQTPPPVAPYAPPVSAPAATPTAYPPPLPPPAYARPQVAVEEPPATPKMLGIGYKIGNGLGLVGADIVVAPIEHLAFDVQLNYFSASEASGTAHGYGFAPAAQGRLFGGQRSTPYVGLGLAHISLTLDNVTATGTAVFANLGFEWRWPSGLGILLGGGVSHLGTITATDQVTTISQKGGWLPNLEVGLRYMFL
jgi:hypothetical protein